MPRFQSQPAVTAFTAADGTSFTADENGVFELDLNAVHIAAFAAHGISLSMVADDPPVASEVNTTTRRTRAKA